MSLRLISKQNPMGVLVKIKKEGRCLWWMGIVEWVTAVIGRSFWFFNGSFYSFVRRMRLLFVLQYNATWFRFLVFKKKFHFCREVWFCFTDDIRHKPFIGRKGFLNNALHAVTKPAPDWWNRLSKDEIPHTTSSNYETYYEIWNLEQTLKVIN